MKHKKVPKNIIDRIVECEAHTMFLINSLYKMEKDPIHYKQVAAELRVLVADKTPKNRIMIHLMDELQIGMDVQLSPPPMKSHIIEKGKLIEQKTDTPFKIYCEKGFAGSIKGRNYTNAQFISLIAQNEGSSHASHQLDPYLASSNQFIINNMPGHVYNLSCIARTVKRCSINLMRFIIEKRGYNPRYNWHDDKELLEKGLGTPLTS